MFKIIVEGDLEYSTYYVTTDGRQRVMKLLDKIKQ